jgi:hypothetical protein|tara:strand:- start:201 stop:491 length:291 start_codon:yes stop_codon:yes gene_type:complete
MSTAPSAKNLNIFVIMNGSRGYYSSRTGGSPFLNDPAEFTLFRNQVNAERMIRREIKSLLGRIESDEKRSVNPQYIAGHRTRLAEWEAAEVVQIVN